MLWIAGLFGLMAIGTVSLVDFSSDRDVSDDEEAELPEEVETVDSFQTPGEVDASAGTEEAYASTESASPQENAEDWDFGSFEPSEDFKAFTANAMPDAADPGAATDIDTLVFETTEADLEEPEEADPISTLEDDAGIMVDEIDFAAALLDEDADFDDEPEYEDGWLAMNDADSFWMGSQSDMIDLFDPERENLLVVWDDATGEEPEVSLEPNPDDPDRYDVKVDHKILVQVAAGAGLTAAHIACVPFSLAASMGWTKSAPTPSTL